MGFNDGGKTAARTSAPLTCLLFGRGGGSYVGICACCFTDLVVVRGVSYDSFTDSSEILSFSCGGSITRVCFSWFEEAAGISADCAVFHQQTLSYHDTAVIIACYEAYLCRVAPFIFLVLAWTAPLRRCTLHGHSHTAADETRAGSVAKVNALTWSEKRE